MNEPLTEPRSPLTPANCDIREIETEPLPEPPYPGDLRAANWRFELDTDRIVESDTWALAGPDVRPLLLMLWFVAWRQTPIGSLPADDRIIAAKIGVSPAMFAQQRDVLLRGWYRCDDGRLYHRVLTERVMSMFEHRRRDRERLQQWRDAKKQSETRDKRVTETPAYATGTGTGTGTDEKSKGVAADAAHLVSSPSSMQDMRPTATPANAGCPPCPYKAIVAAYHEKLPMLRTVVALNDHRCKLIRARWRQLWVERGNRGKPREASDLLDRLTAYFEHDVGRSDFLIGRAPATGGRPPFEADLEWLMDPDNFLKVVEGKYENRAA